MHTMRHQLWNRRSRTGVRIIRNSCAQVSATRGFFGNFSEGFWSSEEITGDLESRSKKESPIVYVAETGSMPDLHGVQTAKLAISIIEGVLHSLYYG